MLFYEGGEGIWQEIVFLERDFFPLLSFFQKEGWRRRYVLRKIPSALS